MVGIHWARYATSKPFEEVLGVTVGLLGGEFAEEVSGRFNQARALKHSSGLTVHFGAEFQEQPVVVEVPGEACECFLDAQIAELGVQLEARMTRCDLAVDVPPASEARARLLAMNEAWNGGQVDTGMRITSTDFVMSRRPGQGCTLYCGSRQSPLFMRAYDRRGDLRIEWEFKPQHAMRSMMPGLLMQDGPGKWWRWMARHAVFPHAWYMNLLDGPLPDARVPRAPVGAAVDTLAALRHQYGVQLSVLLAGGLTPEDLCRVPAVMTKQMRYRLNEFAKSAAAGLDLDLDAMLSRVKRW